MFAYCLNSPSCRVDTEGSDSLWAAIFADGRWGFIHYCVQLHIAACYGMQLEKGIYKDHTLVGRVDIYDYGTGYIWEVKSVGTMTMAAGQLARYVDGTIGKNGPVAKIGPADAFIGNFTISYHEESYEVSYFTPVDGTVLYYVRRVEKRKQYEYAFVPLREQALSNNMQKPAVAAHTPLFHCSQVNIEIPDNGGGVLVAGLCAIGLFAVTTGSGGLWREQIA